MGVGCLRTSHNPPGDVSIRTLLRRWTWMSVSSTSTHPCEPDVSLQPLSRILDYWHRSCLVPAYLGMKKKQRNGFINKESHLPATPCAISSTCLLPFDGANSQESNRFPRGNVTIHIMTSQIIVAWGPFALRLYSLQHGDTTIVVLHFVPPRMLSCIG